jgi:hypothetical protein
MTRRETYEHIPSPSQHRPTVMVGYPLVGAREKNIQRDWFADDI